MGTRGVTARQHYGTPRVTLNIIKSSGNVFADLGVPPGEVVALTQRAGLQIALRKRITANGGRWPELLMHPP